jgi:hypothetical protein
MLERIRAKYYSIKEGIRSLKLWLPIIWKDRYYDHTFIFKILRHKLHLMEQRIRHHGHHLNCERDANKMKVCVSLLDRLIKDEYDERALKGHYKKWGDPKFRFEPIEDRPGYSALFIDHENVKSKEDEEEMRKEFRILVEHAGKQRVNDLDYLCYMIKKHVWSWWD